MCSTAAARSTQQHDDTCATGHCLPQDYRSHSHSSKSRPLTFGMCPPASSVPSHSSHDLPAPGGPHTTAWCAGSPAQCRIVFSARASYGTRSADSTVLHMPPAAAAVGGARSEAGLVALRWADAAPCASVTPAGKDSMQQLQGKHRREVGC
jgi:hypothetical protein